MRDALRATALVLSLLLVASTAAATAPADPVPGTAGIEAVPGTAAFLEDVRVGGFLDTAPECLAGRDVRLERRFLDASTWEEIAQSQTAADGSFAFDLRPRESAAYRGVLAAEARGASSCEEVVSAEATSRVRARVVLRVVDRRLRASRCDRVSVRVRPEKPGQEVRVQRRRGSGWRTVATGSLPDSSEAVVRVCAAWRDLGSIALRAQWLPQDLRNLKGVSSPRDVPVVRAGWMLRLDRMTAGLGVGVSVREGGAFLYRRDDAVRRTPASNEKLLLSMALLDSLGPDARLPTRAMARRVRNGVVRGSLWIVGSGDPEVGSAVLRRLTRRIRDAGIRRIEGSVIGSTRFFRRDWWAPGWRSYFPSRYIARPTALTFRGNEARGIHVWDPERRAAEELTRRLRASGVRVGGRPRLGSHPSGLSEVARVWSRRLRHIVETMNRVSSNFRAEVLGKRLAVARRGPPGSIEKGAAALASWTEARGVTVTAHDGSGLSYWNRVAPRGIARLLESAEAEPWGEVLRASLPRAGVGTLEGRLGGVPLRAKTGTLTRISALSGWVHAKRTGSWVEFSIISSGLPTSTAKDLEDRVVRTLWRYAA